jgi:hypothetical protein
MREQKAPSQRPPGEEMIENLKGLARSLGRFGEVCRSRGLSLAALKTFDGMTQLSGNRRMRADEYELPLNQN